LAFGGPVAEELLARAGLSGTAPSAEAPAASAEALLSAVRELLQEVGERPRGFLYQAGGLLLDVEPYAARRFAGESDIEVLELPTFSEAADRYFPEIRPRVVAPTTEELGRRERMRQREQQLAAIARLEAEVEAWRREADAILAQYPTAEAALEKAASGAAGSEASVEVDLDGVRVRLERGRSARESAQARYEEMKRCQSKLEGARAALEGTDRELAVRAPSASVRPRTERPARRHFWFEQYRWFLSSEAVVVIAGRDAASNDRIVKRYLGDTDRYVHADIHGAASVVVKHPPPGAPPMTELTLREACQWGLAYSKAWRAGRASGDAYWVEAEQVSKAAGSGEFVGRGAWVIHGTKHFFHDLPMELGIGVYRYENEELWGVAPPEALRARGELRAVLSPGEERARPEVEVALAREMGLSRGVLQPMLPAGGLTYRRA
jgi:predicted ribosome quality control (RQC) complex YloA/Tae2 family protein